MTACSSSRTWPEWCQAGRAAANAPGTGAVTAAERPPPPGSGRRGLIAVLLVVLPLALLWSHYGTLRPCGMFRAAIVDSYTAQPGAPMGRAGGEIAAQMFFERFGPTENQCVKGLFKIWTGGVPPMH